MSGLSHMLKGIIVQDGPILFYLSGVFISRFVIVCDIFCIALCSCTDKEHGCLVMFTQLGLLCSNSHKIVLGCSYIELQRLQFVSWYLFCKHRSRDFSTVLYVLAVAFAFAIINCMFNQ